MKHLFPVVCLLLSFQLQAHEYALKDLRIGHPFALPTVSAQANGAAYLTLQNNGSQIVRLVRASTPRAARVELHQMAVENDIARMRPVDGVELKPDATVAMAPGRGYHLMLVGLKQALKDGDKFPMLLEFSGVGKIEVEVHVQKPKDGTHGHDH